MTRRPPRDARRRWARRLRKPSFTELGPLLDALVAPRRDHQRVRRPWRRAKPQSGLSCRWLISCRWINGRIEKVDWTRDRWLTRKPVDVPNCPPSEFLLETPRVEAIMWRRHTYHYDRSTVVDFYLPDGTRVTQEHLDAVEKALHARSLI